MQRALEELRLADAKALADAEEQKALKRTMSKPKKQRPLDRSAPKGDESVVPGEEDIQMIDVEAKRERSLGSSVQLDDDEEASPGNPEEERRRRLEKEANSIRIGYQRSVSEEDEEMIEEGQLRKRQRKGKKNDDRLKQTKLAFTNLSG